MLFRYVEFIFFTDDDFAESTPPLAKKPKLANKENKLKKSEKQGKKKETNQTRQDKMFCIRKLMVVR